jgi:Flp pilus assembly protein TadD
MPRRLRQWAILGLGWFLITLVPGLNIVPLINEYSLILAAEHFLYLPVAGLLIFLAAGAAWILRLTRGEITRGFRNVVFLVVMFFCVCLTVQMNEVWRGEVPLFERAARFEPGLGRVHLLLGRAYAQTGRFQEALGEYGRGLQIMQDYVKKARQSRAREVYLHFVKTAHFDLGQVFMALGDLARSNDEFEAAMRVRLGKMAARDVEVSDGMAASNLGMNFIRMGERGKARRAFQLAVVLDPDNAQGMSNLGMTYLDQGNKFMARFWFERALKADPGFRPAWENLKRVDPL